MRSLSRIMADDDREYDKWKAAQASKIGFWEKVSLLYTAVLDSDVLMVILVTIMGLGISGVLVCLMLAITKGLNL